MMSAGVLSSKACIVRRPVAFVAPKASAPRGVAMRAVRAEGEEEKEKKEAKKAKAASLRCVNVGMWAREASGSRIDASIGG
jgi:hypothetical protein